MSFFDGWRPAGKFWFALITLFLLLEFIYSMTELFTK